MSESTALESEAMGHAQTLGTVQECPTEREVTSDAQTSGTVQERPTEREVTSDATDATADAPTLSVGARRKSLSIIGGFGGMLSELVVPSPLGEVSRRPKLTKETKSQSAVQTSVKSEWAPPPLRRTKSFDETLIPWDLRVTVNVEKNAEGCRELRIGLRCYGRSSQVGITFRTLAFWLVLLVAVVPTGAFRAVPNLWTAPAQAHVSRGAVSAHGALPLGTVAVDESASAAASSEDVLASMGWQRELPSIALFRQRPPLDAADDHECFVGGSSQAVADGVAQMEPQAADELLARCDDFDACMLDAESEDGLQACMAQFHLSSLEEISAVIAKEGTEMLKTTDDGTFSCLVYNLLDTAKRVHDSRAAPQAVADSQVAADSQLAAAKSGGGTPREPAAAVEPLHVTFRRQVFRTCVSVSMHKLTVAALPVVTGLLHISSQ